MQFVTSDGLRRIGLAKLLSGPRGSLKFVCVLAAPDQVS